MSSVTISPNHHVSRVINGGKPFSWGVSQVEFLRKSRLEYPPNFKEVTDQMDFYWRVWLSELLQEVSTLQLAREEDKTAMRELRSRLDFTTEELRSAFIAIEDRDDRIAALTARIAALTAAAKRKSRGRKAKKPAARKRKKAGK